MKALKLKILKDRTELTSTSAQDEFSKWAKLRRRLDKSISELESLSIQSNQSKLVFSGHFKKFLWLIMTALPFIFSSYHRKAAVFYLPLNWFGPSTWFLSLPSAPTGKKSPLFTLVFVWFSLTDFWVDFKVHYPLLCSLWLLKEQ